MQIWVKMKWINDIILWTLVNDIMHGEDMKGDKCCSTYRQKESLSSTGLEELLPLVSVPHREGDGVDAVLELGWDRAGPLVQLEVKQHMTLYTEEVSKEFPESLSKEESDYKQYFSES